MSYNKTRWIDGSAPAINATNLNHIEDGIEDVDSRVTVLETDPTTKNYVDEKILEETAARVLADEELQNSKQDTLISGTNIKTINGDSLLGSGNLVIENTNERVGYIPSVINAVYEQGSLVGYTFDSRYFGEFQKEICCICLGQAFGNALFYSTIGKDPNSPQTITSRTFYSLGTNYGTTYDPTTSSSYTRLFRYKLVYSYYNTTLTYSEEEILKVENNLSNLSWGGYPPTSSAVNTALNNKQNKLPDVSSTGTYALKSINGILTWVQE